jgi:hypothetical protein
VLEGRRLRAVLSTLSKSQLDVVITGLETLARACAPAAVASRHRAQAQPHAR